MTPPTERERKWLEQVLRIHGFTKDSSPMDIRKGVLAVAAEVLTQTKEACAHKMETLLLDLPPQQIKTAQIRALSAQVRNLEITGEWESDL